MIDIYFLCNQTVTLYHICKTEGTEKVLCRTVIEKGAYFEKSRNYKLEKLGLGVTITSLVTLPLSKVGKTYMPPNEFQTEFQDNNFSISAGDIIIPGSIDCLELIKLTPVNYPEMMKVGSISLVRGLDGNVSHIEVGS